MCHTGQVQRVGGSWCWSSLGLYVGLAVGCHAGKASPAADGGSPDAASIASAGRGASGENGGVVVSSEVDSGVLDGFKATLSASALSVCPGQCVELTANATGGVAPYRFTWDPDLGGGAGPQMACPTQTTRYTVQVGDASQTTEFTQQNAAVSASLSIGVMPASACAADSTTDDAGVPNSPARELCSLRGLSDGVITVIGNEQNNHQSLVDAQGNFVLVGSFVGTLEVGGTTLTASGLRDGFVIKLGPDCRLIWAQAFGTESAGQLGFTALAADGNGALYLGGSFSGKTQFGDSAVAQSEGFAGLLLKLDAGGKVVWSKMYKSANAAVGVTDLVIDAQHRLTLVGFAGTDTSFGGAPLGLLYAASVPFLAQLTTDGTFGWSRTFTDPDLSYGLANRPNDDNFVLTGWGTKNIDLGAGNLSLGHGGRFLAKLNAAGQQQWLRALSPGADIDNQWDWWRGGVAVDLTGSIVLLRDEPQTQQDSSRLLDDSVEKYAPDGTPVWQRRLTDASNYDMAWSSALTVLSDAHPLRFGSFSGTTAVAGQTLMSRGASELALVELSPDGVPLSVYAVGGAFDNSVLGVTHDAADHIFASYISARDASEKTFDLVVVKLSR